MYQATGCTSKNKLENSKRIYFVMVLSESVRMNVSECLKLVKTRLMFTVHTTPEEFENAAITGHFGFGFEENWVRVIT